MFRFKPSRITWVGILSYSSYLSALNSYPQTGIYRSVLVSPSTDLSSNSSDTELPRDMLRFKPSRITWVGILSNSSYLSALNSYPQTGLYRQALVSSSTELSSNSSDRELPRDMLRFKPSRITLVGILSLWNLALVRRRFAKNKKKVQTTWK